MNQHALVQNPRIGHSACPHDCPDTCALMTTVQDGVAIKVQGNPAHRPTAGVLCAKVSHYPERTYHPQRLLRPLRAVRISSHDFAVMVSMAIRFVPTLLLEFDRLRDAQLSRGADFREGTVPERLKKVSSLAAVLVLQTVQRADDLAQAMDGRGYARGSRTYLKELKMGYADYTVMIFALAFVAVLYVFPF